MFKPINFLNQLLQIWFVWSVADKYMVSAAFEHDREWPGADQQRLPLSFQPDNIERIETDAKIVLHAKEQTVFDVSIIM